MNVQIQALFPPEVRPFFQFSRCIAVLPSAGVKERMDERAHQHDVKRSIVNNYLTRLKSARGVLRLTSYSLGVDTLKLGVGRSCPEYL